MLVMFLRGMHLKLMENILSNDAGFEELVVSIRAGMLFSNAKLDISTMCIE